MARPVPAHDEFTPYLQSRLRNGLTPSDFYLSLVYSIDEPEVLGDEADGVIAEEIIASAFDAFLGKLSASLTGVGASINAFTTALFDNIRKEVQRVCPSFDSE